MSGQRRQSWVLWAGVGVAAIALAGISISTFLLRSWGEVQRATPAQAGEALEVARAALADKRVYIEIAPDGSVQVHRELETRTLHEIHSLRLVAWEPGPGRLIRIDFPYWFVRIKLTRSLNLGTFTTALSGDWGNLDLRVAEEDLERRGPGLLLDHVAANGSRLLLWTE